ncbi:MAG: peptide-methionine (R)-S-oxide reductase MsrB [Kiloniellaceae bacterium]
MLTRRNALLTAAASLALLSLHGAAAAAAFEVTRSAAEWRRLLNADEYAVLREEATEKPGSSPLLTEKRAGLYHCKGCDLAVYSSEHKYDSGTGWPSFWQARPDAVGTKEDSSFFSTRTEVHCRRCGGHFGHIFDDGPPPTGERHCLNGLALTFRPQAA